MQSVTCPTCKIVFGVSSSFYTDKVDSGEEFYCPDGHTLHYTPTRAQLMLEVDELEKKRDDWRDAWHGLLDDLRKTQRERKAARCSAAGYKSQWLRVTHELGDLKAYLDEMGVDYA